jgi:hypothetical protein
MDFIDATDIFPSVESEDIDREPNHETAGGFFQGVCGNVRFLFHRLSIRKMSEFSVILGFRLESVVRI